MSSAQIGRRLGACQAWRMSAEAKTYHHGDLRAALLAAARARLAIEGHEALSLRALARDIGVASSAPYAHFASRDALLWALIEDAAQALGEMFDRIAKTAVSPPDRLAMVGRAYLGFALAEPEMMRLIWVSSFTADRVPQAADWSIGTFEALVANVMPVGGGSVVRDVAIGCWSVLHGFAMLRLHGKLSPDIDAGQAADTIVAAAVRLARTA